MWYQEQVTGVYVDTEPLNLQSWLTGQLALGTLLCLP